MWVAVLWSSLTWAADCDSPTSASQLTAHVQEAMLAFATLDEEAFADAAGAARTALPCVDAVLSPTDAAAFHRMNGLAAFLDGNPDAALESFTAARAIEPEQLLSSKIAPEGGRLYRIYDEAAVAPKSPMVAMNLGNLVAVVDGSETKIRPTARPAIVQFVEGNRLVSTAYVETGEDLEIPVRAPEVATAEEALNRSPTEKRRSGIWLATGLSGAAAAGLYGTAVVFRGQFDDAPSEDLFHRTNGVYWGSVGVGALAVGLGSIAIAGSF